MSCYFCLGRFIELIKERYSNITKLVICFDLRKSVNKTKSNQLHLHSFVIAIIDDKKLALDYSKLIEICGGETDDDDIADTYEIVITLSQVKNKKLNTNKNFQLLDISTDLNKFTTKDKKIIEYFPSQIINNVNNILFNSMISKKKDL
jgi:hypothetical protein